jgi:hypothetical protein
MSDAAFPDLQGRPKGGLLKKLILFPLGIALLGGGGFGAGLYYAGERLSPSQEVLRLIEQESATAEAEGETGPKRVSKEKPESPVFETQYYEFPDPLPLTMSVTLLLLFLTTSGLGAALSERVARALQHLTEMLNGLPNG